MTSSSSNSSNPLRQITNGNGSNYPQRLHQAGPARPDQEQHHKFQNLSSRNLADVPKDITMESSLDTTRSSIHSNSNFNPSIKSHKRKNQAASGLSRSASLTTSNGFVSTEDDTDDEGTYHVDLMIREEEGEEMGRREDEDKGIGSSTPSGKQSLSEQFDQDWKAPESQSSLVEKDPFRDPEERRNDSRAFSSTSTTRPPPQSYQEAKKRASGMLGSVRGSNVSLGKKGGAQAIDGYLNLSVSRHGLIRTFALPPSSIKTLSFNSLSHLLELDMQWERSRWAQLPLKNGKRAKREPGKSVLGNLNPLGKNQELAIWVEHPVRSGEWKKVEQWKASRSQQVSSGTSRDSSLDVSESHSLVSVLMQQFWDERLKSSGYTHLTIRASKDGPPGAARLRTTSTSSTSSLTSKLKRKDASNLSASSSGATLASGAASESEGENVYYEAQPTGLERVGRHLSRLSVSLASLFGALDVAAERGGRSSDRESYLDPEDLGYVNVRDVSDEETDGQRPGAGLRRRIGNKVNRGKASTSSRESIREDGGDSSTRRGNSNRSGALGLLVQILPAPLLRFSGLSRLKSSTQRKKTKKPVFSRNADSTGNGFISIQSDAESDVDALSLHTSAGISSDLETDLDPDAEALDPSDITSNSAKIRKLFKTPLTNNSTSSFDSSRNGDYSDADGERGSISNISRSRFKGKNKRRDASESDTDGWVGAENQRQASLLRKAAMKRKNSDASVDRSGAGGGFWKALLGTRLGSEAERRDSVDSVERGRKENLKQRKWVPPQQIRIVNGKSGFKERLDIESPDKLRFSQPLPAISNSNSSRTGSKDLPSPQDQTQSEEDDNQDAATIATSRALSSYDVFTSSKPSTVKASSLKTKDQPLLPSLDLSSFGRSSNSRTFSSGLKGSSSPTAVSTNGSYRSKKTVELDDDPFRSQPLSIAGRMSTEASPGYGSSPSPHPASLIPGTRDPATPKGKMPALKRTASLDTITGVAPDSGFASDKKAGKSKPSAWRFKLNRESADGYASAGDESQSASVPASPSGGSLLRLGRRRTNSSSSSIDLPGGISRLRRSSLSKSKDKKDKEDEYFKGATVIGRPEESGMRWAGEGRADEGNRGGEEKKRMSD